MREARTEIEIAAPPEAVWNCLMDIDSWGDWSPIINRALGAPALGAVMDITMTGKAGKSGKDGPNYKPVVVDFEAPKMFRWRTKMMGGVMID